MGRQSTGSRSPVSSAGSEESPGGRPFWSTRRGRSAAHGPTTTQKCPSSTSCSQRRRCSRTMIVSLEAIFLSTFVMISQNRADAKRQVIADQQWQTVKEEDRQNVELIDLSNQILELTKAIHSITTARSGTQPQ